MEEHRFVCCIQLCQGTTDVIEIQLYTSMVHNWVYLPVCLSISWLVCLCVCMPVILSVCLSVCLLVRKNVTWSQGVKSCLSMVTQFSSKSNPKLSVCGNATLSAGTELCSSVGTLRFLLLPHQNTDRRHFSSKCLSRSLIARNLLPDWQIRHA
jgi:hypothetical protein